VTNDDKRKRMKVLIACEFSGIVRDAFLALGHDAMSCDLLQTEVPGPHYQGNVLDLLGENADMWDLMIAHPPCTHMAVCGNGTWANTPEREAAQEWTRKLWDACVNIAPKVCFENPVSTLSRALPVKAEYIQPYQFGHPETKKTGLWLHGLPMLEETNNVYEHMMTLPLKDRHKVWYASPGADRGKERSKFFQGVADAMADQWGTT
jgi:hypothetical protein